MAKDERLGGGAVLLAFVAGAIAGAAEPSASPIATPRASFMKFTLA